MFDFAMMAWQMLSRRLFMAGVTTAVAVQRVQSGCRPDHVPGSCIPACIMDMLSKGWAVNPCDRPPIRAFVAVFTQFSPPLHPLLRCNVRDLLHLAHCEAPSEALADVCRASQQHRLQQLQREQCLIQHPHLFDANLSRKLLRSPCIAHDGEVYDSQSLSAWIKWMGDIIGDDRFLSPATLMTYNVAEACVRTGADSGFLSFHQPAHSLIAQLKELDDVLSGSVFQNPSSVLVPPDPLSKGPSISSVSAPLKELRCMYEHASLPVSTESLSTCQVRCKRWSKYIMEIGAKVTGLTMLRYQELLSLGLGNAHARQFWFVEEKLREYPYVLNTSLAIERGISTLHILRRFCEGNGWDSAAQLYSSCAIELEYALWSLWPFLHNRCLPPPAPPPPHLCTLVPVGPGEHCMFASLALAVEAARCGDTILVVADLFEAECIIAIEKDLHIVGCSPNGIVNIQARFYISAEVRFSRVCLQGVSFVDSEPTINCSGPGARVSLKNCHLTSSGRKEIMLINNHATCVMKGCLIYNGGDVAVMVEDCSRLSMMECDVLNVGVGILLAGKSKCSARLCSFKDCREHAIIVIDPLPRDEATAVVQDMGAAPTGTSLFVDRTTFINRYFVLFPCHLLLSSHCPPSGFIAPHKHARNPSDAFMNVAFSTVLIQVLSAAIIAPKQICCLLLTRLAEIQPVQATDVCKGRQGTFNFQLPAHL